MNTLLNENQTAIKVEFKGFNILNYKDNNGAGDGIRTRDLQLGKLTLYH